MTEKEPQRKTEPAPKEPFEVFLLRTLEEKLKAIAQEPINKRDESALEVLRDIALDTAVEFIEDDPNEPELPEKKLVLLPFGDFYVRVDKQSHANFFTEHFGAIEITTQRPKEKHNPSPYIESYDKVFKCKKGRSIEVRHVLDEKGNIIHTSVTKHDPALRR